MINIKEIVFFKNLIQIVQENNEGMIIIGGDWNEIQWKKDRKSNKKIPTCSKLKKLKKNFNLIDTWKLKNPNKQQFTWKRKNSNSEASRIDYFLVQNELSPKITHADIRPATIKYTDHMAVTLKIDNKNSVRGTGYWKLNNSLLNDNAYVRMIENIIMKYTKMSNSNKDKSMIWELCKIEIREKSIKYSKSLSKKSKNKIHKLEDELKTKINNNENQESIESTEQELEKEYERKAKGAQIRARVKWIEEGELNTKYFLNLENKRQLQKQS